MYSHLQILSGAYRVYKATSQCFLKLMPNQLCQLRSLILLNNVYIMLLSILLFVPLQSNLMCNVTIYNGAVRVTISGLEFNHANIHAHMINEKQL
jgi:hypothetical protein